MRVRALIDAARAHGLALGFESENLIVEADHDPLPELLAELRQHKVELIAVLRHERETSPAPAENCVGAPHAWAVGFARLDPDRPPCDVPLQRWLQFINDFGRFLNTGFGEQAARRGWSRLELFGCDRDRPFARIDQSGLIWLLNGDRLVALTANAGIIESHRGVRLSFYRKPSSPDRVSAWEL